MPDARVVNQLVANVDFAPTIAALAGVTPPSETDGRSLVPLFTGIAPPDWRTSVLIEHIAPFIGHLVSYSGLRTMDHKLARYVTAEIELYDLPSDPDEMENQFGKVGRAVIDQWNTRLESAAACRSAACP